MPAPDNCLGRRDAIEIRIGDAPLAVKLDAIGAAIDAIKTAHRDTISPAAWAALNRAQEAIAEAMLAKQPAALIASQTFDRRALSA